MSVYLLASLTRALRVRHPKVQVVFFKFNQKYVKELMKGITQYAIPIYKKYRK